MAESEKNIPYKPENPLGARGEASENTSSVDSLKDGDTGDTPKLREKILSGEVPPTVENLGKLSFNELLELSNTMGIGRSEIQQFMMANYPQQLFANAMQSINAPGDTDGAGAVQGINTYLSPALVNIRKLYGKIGENLLSQNTERLKTEERAEVAQLSREVS